MKNSKPKDSFRMINIDLTKEKKFEKWRETQDKYGLYPDVLIFVAILHILAFPVFLARQNSNADPNRKIINLQDTILENKLTAQINDFCDK